MSTPTINIPSSITIPGQQALDNKGFFVALDDLKNLGDNNKRAFIYYDGLILYCSENQTRYVWKEREENDDPGLLDEDFVYPENYSSFGIDYSEKAYNFFEFHPVTKEQVRALLSSIPNGILEGGNITWSGTGYLYYVSSVTVKFDNTSNPITFPFTSITFDDGDSTHDRFDFPFVDFEGVKIKKGDPSANPLIPQLEEGQYGLTPIFIKANTTAPDPVDIPTTKVYAENEPSPEEFSGSFIGTGTVNFESPISRTGLKAIEFTNIVSGGRVTMEAPANFDLNDIDSVSLWVRLKSNFLPNQNLQIYFRDENDIQLTGAYNLSFNKSQVGEYQFVAASINSLNNLGNGTIARKIILRYTTVNFNPKDGFFVDDWNLQGGISQPTPIINEHDALNGIKGDGTYHTSKIVHDNLNKEIKNINVTPYNVVLEDLNRILVFSSITQVVNIPDNLANEATVAGLNKIEFEMYPLGTGVLTVNHSNGIIDTFNQRAHIKAKCTDIAGDSFWSVKEWGQLIRQNTNSYVGVRLKPSAGLINGFLVERSSNTRNGYEAVNTSGGNSATTSFVARGASDLYTNLISMQWFGSGYFIEYLREKGAIYSTDTIFHLSANAEGSHEFRTGSTFTNQTKKFKVWFNGAIEIFRATLASITNAAAGFIIGNSDDGNRPNYHNGTEWKGLAYKDEVETLQTNVPVLANTKIQNIQYDYPNWWEGYRIPVSVDSTGRAIFDYDIDKLLEFDIMSKTPYYISPTGNNSNDGLTPANAKATLLNARSAGAELIYMLPGIYYRDTFTGNNLNIAGADLFVFGIGNVYITTAQKDLSWALDSGTTYFATRGSVAQVFDSDFLDDEGLFVIYPKMSTLEECRTTPGSWHQAGSTVFVHRLDGSIPTNNVFILLNLDQRVLSDTGRVYWKNLNFVGISVDIKGNSSASVLEAYLKDIKAQYPRIHSNGTTTYNNVMLYSLKIGVTQNLTISNPTLDGINFTDLLGVSKMNVVEINSRVSNVKATPGSNQCSTAHNGINVLRIGCNYNSGRPQTVADVNTGTQSILVGCELNAGNDEATTVFYGVDADLFGCKMLGNKLITEVDESEGGVTVRNSIVEISGTTGEVTIEN